MKQGNEGVMQYHQQRRDSLRTMQGSFSPSKEELEREKQRFLANGGVIKKLIIGKDSIPSVWGDFVKSKTKSS
jgi:hypothetical protein